MAAKKKTIKKKTNTVRLSVKASRTFDEAYKGTEPVFSENSTMDDVLTGMNWYSYFYEGDQAKAWLLEYMQSVGFDRSEIAQVKSSPWHKSGLLIEGGEVINLKFAGFLARMCMRGLKNLPQHYADRMSNVIEYSKKLSVAQKVVRQAEQEKNPDENKPSIQDHIHTQVLGFCAEIEYAIDDFFDNDLETSFSVYDYLKSNDVKGLIAKKIGEEFFPHLQEIDDIENDDDLKEGYSFLKKPQIKKYRKFLQSIIDDCERYSSNQNKQRKPRKKKPVAIDKQVAKLNYKKDDDEYKISSINPVEIIGASQLWVFNSKYRKLGVYYASGSDGLSIKGSTLQGFEEEKSLQKTLRKPEEVLTKILNGSKTSIRKQFDTINSKEQRLTGRINAETVLLKLIK